MKKEYLYQESKQVWSREVTAGLVNKMVFYLETKSYYVNKLVTLATTGQQ